MKRRILASVTVLAIIVAYIVIVGSAGASSPTAPTAPVPFRTIAISKGPKLHVGATVHGPVVVHGKKVKSYQWERCNAKGGRCSKIKGATHRSYKLTKKDVGHTIVVRMIVGNTIVTSAPTGVVAPPLPVNTALPTISDVTSGTTSSVTVGDVLNGKLGTWTGAISYEWVWQHCSTALGCSTVASGGPVTDAATVPTYTVVSGDQGDTIVLVVTAFNTKQ